MNLLRNFKKKQWIFILFIPLYVLYILPFLNNVVYDAVVHFAFAENFVHGFPFRYNVTDEIVLASTSPFWTVLLVLFYFLAGYKSVILLKIFIILCWSGVTYLLYKTAKQFFTKSQLLIVIFYWLLNVSVVKNSFGGMENILAAFQILLLLNLLQSSLREFTIKHTLFAGLISGWALLTRPEIGILCILNIFIYLTFYTKSRRFHYILITSGAIIFVLLPWYIFQYSVTGRLVSDSAYARMYSGRGNSFVILNRWIYFHPSLTISLLTAFLPVTIGFIVKTKGIFFSKIILKDNFFLLASVINILYGFLFFSFIVGGNQIGRYFLPLYPFFIIAGFSGFFEIYNRIKNRNVSFSKAFAVIVILFLISVNIFDYYNRVVKAFAMELSISEMIESPKHRQEFTSSFLIQTGFNETDTIKTAVTEVQFRYYTDNRIIVESLDGRSSSKVFKCIDKDWFPDYSKFIMAEKPDIVEVKDWIIFTKPLIDIKWLPFGKKYNILAEWDSKIHIMQLGDKFLWNDYEVSYIMPGYVKINWKKN